MATPTSPKATAFRPAISSAALQVTLFSFAAFQHLIPASENPSTLSRLSVFQHIYLY